MTVAADFLDERTHLQSLTWFPVDRLGMTARIELRRQRRNDTTSLRAQPGLHNHPFFSIVAVKCSVKNFPLIPSRTLYHGLSEDTGESDCAELAVLFSDCNDCDEMLPCPNFLKSKQWCAEFVRR